MGVASCTTSDYPSKGTHLTSRWCAHDGVVTAGAPRPARAAWRTRRRAGARHECDTSTNRMTTTQVHRPSQGTALPRPYRGRGPTAMALSPSPAWKSRHRSRRARLVRTRRRASHSSRVFFISAASPRTGLVRIPRAGLEARQRWTAFRTAGHTREEQAAHARGTMEGSINARKEHAQRVVVCRSCRALVHFPQALRRAQAHPQAGDRQARNGPGRGAVPAGRWLLGAWAALPQRGAVSRRPAR